MAGKIKSLLDAIIEKRSNGNPTLASTTKTKLILKGFNPDKYGPNSPDDPVVLKQIQNLAAKIGV